MNPNNLAQKRHSLPKTLVRMSTLILAGGTATAFTFQGCGSHAKIASQSSLTPEQAEGSGSLTVLLIVDQMRPDYIDRFRPLLLKTETGNNGLLWLADSGVRFENTRTAAAPTVTAAGHASVCTGSAPAIHGIAANEFFDGSEAVSKTLVSDPSAAIIRTSGLLSSGPLEQSAPDSGSSSWRLRTLTLGERFKRAAISQGQRAGKSVAVAIKDRAALSCAGSVNDGAYYFDVKSGSLVTSSKAGRDSLPQWVDAYNRSHRPESYGNWNLALANPSDYGVALDSNEFAATTAFLQSRTQKIGKPGDFPHLLRPQASSSLLEVYDRFTLMPAASDYIVEFALEAAISEKLGQGGSSDILVISFSTPDLVGHSYGSASLELVDTYLHLHASIENLRNRLPKILGHERITYALTADHGIQQIPEALRANGKNAGRLDAKAFQLEVNQIIEGLAKSGNAQWVDAFITDQIFLNRKQLKESRQELATFAREVAKKIEKMPGIFAAFTAAEVAESSKAYASKRYSSVALGNELVTDKRSYALKFLSRGYHPAVAGDIYIVPQEGWQFGYAGIAANHGSPWDADSRIPWLLAGPGVPGGIRVSEPTFADDIVPTLLDLAHLNAPSSRSKGSTQSDALQDVTGQSRKSLFERFQK